MKSEVNNERRPNPPHKAECLKSEISDNSNNEYFVLNNNNGSKYNSVSSSGGTKNEIIKSSWNNNYSSNQGNKDNSSRFSSVGSKYNNNDDHQEETSGYMGSFKYYLGSALHKTMDVAINIKEKVSEMDLGTKIKNTGWKTVEIIKDTGIKVKVGFLLNKGFCSYTNSSAKGN